MKRPLRNFLFPAPLPWDGVRRPAERFTRFFEETRRHVRTDQPFKERRGHQCGDDRHDDQRGKEFRRDEAALQADVDDDEFHEAARVHQGADAERLAVGEAARPCRQPAGHALADDRRGQHRRAHHQRKPELSSVIRVFNPE